MTLVTGRVDTGFVSFSANFETNCQPYAVIVLSIYAHLFVWAIVRSVNTVPAGQAEAARAIGLGFMDTARMIIFPRCASCSWAIRSLRGEEHDSRISSIRCRSLGHDEVMIEFDADGVSDLPDLAGIRGDCGAFESQPPGPP